MEIKEITKHVFIGKAAPDFTSKAISPSNNIEDFNLYHHIKNHKAVIFFYPLDFTFVCPTEIIAFNNRIGEFIARATKIIAISVDSHYSHLAWKNTSYQNGGIGHIQIPMISDLGGKIASAYNVLNDDGISLRGTFLIDEHLIVRHILVNDLPLGRNVDETLRTIDALDHYTKHGEVCPAGWQKGEEGMKPSRQGVEHYMASFGDSL
jgi:peroxiredoxin (alkyl hydroperoxide reductase subunit C)